MSRSLNLKRLFEIARFYQAAAVNAAFGFGMYALLVHFGLNIFVAQIISHFIGVAFNYFTYSRHVFHDSGPAKFRFVMAYTINYLIGLGALAVISYFVRSPYIAGFTAMVAASLINYIVLKYAVFTRKAV